MSYPGSLWWEWRSPPDASSDGDCDLVLQRRGDLVVQPAGGLEAPHSQLRLRCVDPKELFAIGGSSQSMISERNR